MSVKFNTGLRNYIVDYGIVAGLSYGKLDIYTGSQPSSPNDSPTGTLLVTIDTSLVWNSASNGSASLSADATGVAVESGTAGWARLQDSGGTYSIDGTVGTSGADFIIDDTTIVETATVTLTECTITQPES